MVLHIWGAAYLQWWAPRWHNKKVRPTLNVEQNLRRGEGRVFSFIKKVHLHSIQEQTRTWPYHTQVCVIFMVTMIKIVGVMTDMKVTMTKIVCLMADLMVMMTKIVSLMTDMKMMMTKIVGLMTDLMVMMVCWQRLVVGEPGPASSRALTKRYERRIVIVIIIVINGHHFHFGHCPEGSLVIANITFNIVSQILKLQERPLEST